MILEEIKACLEKPVIVADRWGFGLKFYQFDITGIKIEIFKNDEQISLYGNFPKEKYRPILEPYFYLKRGSRTVYKPS